MASRKNPKIEELLKKFNAVVEEIRQEAVTSGSDVYLTLPGSYESVHVLTEDEFIERGEFLQNDEEPGDWVSSSAFC